MEQLLHDFSPGLFFWQSVIVLILIFLLKKFAWKPILDSVSEREEGIQNALDQAEEAKKALADLQASNEELLKEARTEREAMLKQARETRDSLVNGAAAEAKAEADKILTNAQEAIHAEKQKAMVDIKNQVAELSIEVATKILKDSLSSAESQKALAEKYVADLKLN
jgi:F-type H+-transporting ATPase subunit b